MKKLFTVLACLPLAGCYFWIDVERTSYRNSNSDVYVSSVKTEQKAGPFFFAPRADIGLTYTQINRCFDPDVRKDVYILYTEPYKTSYNRVYDSRVPNHFFEADDYKEVFDKLCTQYGKNNDLRMLGTELLSCFPKYDKGYKHPWLVAQEQAECQNLAKKLEKGYKEN